MNKRKITGVTIEYDSDGISIRIVRDNKSVDFYETRPKNVTRILSCQHNMNVVVWPGNKWLAITLDEKES